MGKNKHSICHCDYCVYGRTRRKSMNDVDDYEDFVPYKRSTRKVKGCKKSKTGEDCKFNTPKVVGTTWTMHEGKRYSKYQYIITCERCGKYSYKGYQWNF